MVAFVFKWGQKGYSFPVILRDHFFCITSSQTKSFWKKLYFFGKLQKRSQIFQKIFKNDCTVLTTKNTSKRLLIVGEIFQIKKKYRFWCCFCCFLLRSFWPTKTWGQKSNFWLSKQHVEWGLRRAFFFFLLRCSWTTKNWGQKAKFCWSKQQSERRLRQTMLFALLRGNTNKGTKGNLLPN